MHNTAGELPTQTEPQRTGSVAQRVDLPKPRVRIVRDRTSGDSKQREDNSVVLAAAGLAAVREGHAEAMAD
jgi:hypothetical protein